MLVVEAVDNLVAVSVVYWYRDVSLKNNHKVDRSQVAERWL